ncbi:MAG: glutamate-5-semialdehyde dehydrogenase [Planctomycetota bacterium]|nr:glutamate-5-semialdehyde dehydrogenase [Planctomycetota bacterium]MEC8894680.1 glutamate-5-semialdehyde dehydrogenase [Planctomycetota bacterium]
MNTEANGNPGVEAVARRARAAALQLAALSAEPKNAALEAVGRKLQERREAILEANRADKADCEAELESGSLSPALFKRLDLEGSKFEAMLAGVGDVARLPDPVGRVTLATRLDDGLELYRVSCPLGVIGVIFEARPEAAVQIASLALKSSNAVILKGGREASRTNEALVEAIREALGEVDGVSPDAVQLVSTREEVREMLDLDRWIDLIIPRGSNELVQSIQEATRIPVLGHADGICSVYLDRDADLEKAVAVSVDAKTHYPAACNACETLLVHRDRLDDLLPAVGAALVEAGVELRADEEASARLEASAAAAEDYDTEFLDKVLAVKTVSSLQEAVEHINLHGSHHTDAIVTEDAGAAEYFLSRVDSAGVFHNASTRFADGFRFGLGAEVGISTNKTHARGPVGLEGLVIYKYRLYGAGHVAADYDPGGRKFLHEGVEPPELP